MKWKMDKFDPFLSNDRIRWKLMHSYIRSEGRIYATLIIRGTGDAISLSSADFLTCRHLASESLVHNTTSSGHVT